MKLLRFILVLVVLAYAGWLVWPIVSPFLEGASPGAASMRAGAEAGSQGLPTAVLWIAAAVLYLVAALMLGSGNPKAAIAYFLGFIADAALRLALDGGRAGGEIAARSAEAVGPATSGLGIDPTWLVLGALLVLGGLIVVVSRRRRRHRTPGQLTI
ncbi:LPXTG cell wall anchor domain-containing protein [uncultured Brevundimonas sp.]|uniref:LPXTG cell wall anchor domain-containing protein n=1 Tax=uncultured Brevundimonas sp. TaxID=213418 RepID=UPI0030EB2287|tara:strand:+ start:1748 stop:2215 length:468 start_codon:yes stop_codon:yes gene_type:complete